MKVFYTIIITLLVSKNGRGQNDCSSRQEVLRKCFDTNACSSVNNCTLVLPPPEAVINVFEPSPSDCVEAHEWTCHLESCCPSCREAIINVTVDCGNEESNCPIQCTTFTINPSPGPVSPPPPSPAPTSGAATSTAAAATLCEEWEGSEDPGLKCISQSVWDYTQCLIGKCDYFEEEPACTTATTLQGDTCAHVEGVCKYVSQSCGCSECSCALKHFMDCSLGDACPPFDCSAGNEEEKEEPIDLGEQEFGSRRLQTDFDCFADTVGAYTQCVEQKCPEAPVCTGGSPEHGDTCNDVQEMCQVISTVCCPLCEQELELMLTCATGGLCLGLDCSPVGSSENLSITSGAHMITAAFATGIIAVALFTIW